MQVTTIYDQVPRKMEPFTSIPKSVFENCNQGTRNNYNDAYLTVLREKVKTLSATTLSEMCKGNASTIIKKGEEFDWINGLDSLEQEFIQRQVSLLDHLTVETVMRYNGIFSRFANEQPGEFRERDIIWPRRDLDINEDIASGIFDRLFQDQLGCSQHEYFTREHNKAKKCLVKPSRLNMIFENIVRDNGLRFTNEVMEKKYEENKHTLNLRKAGIAWVKECGEKDKIDLVQWYKSRFHYFPLVTTLRQDLEQSLASIRNETSHPIEKACRIWLDIVRIHVSHEANKRTGKALASAILLSHGYLPPVIDKEDEREYLDTLQIGIESKNGLEVFSQFIVRMMIKTADRSREFAKT